MITLYLVKVANYFHIWDPLWSSVNPSEVCGATSSIGDRSWSVFVPQHLGSGVVRESIA